MLRFLKIFVSGIRAKLALFTGSLITLTILILSWTTVSQQTAILTESYEKQAAISKKYISSLVIELNNIAQNLIQVEEFRKQIAEQQKALKVYQTSKTVVQEKKVNLGLFKTNLFGALGTKKVHYVVDTFYSKYLNATELQVLEKRIRAQVESYMGSPMAERDWKALQYFAQKITVTDNSKALFKLRGQLDAKIAALLLPSRRKIIQETGLEQRLLRIQTFPVSDLENVENIEPSFDTNLISKESPLSALVNHAELDQNSKRVLSELALSPASSLSQAVLDFQWNGLEVEALYSPLFAHPTSTLWAKAQIYNAKQLVAQKNFLQRDLKSANEIAALFPKIKARLKILKEKKPPLPPYADKEFVTLYRAYDRIIKERGEATDATLGSPPKDALSHNDIALESLRVLRDAAWEDSILLRYKHDESESERYLASLKDREFFKKRWALLRRWVSEARSETAPDALKRLYTNGQVAKSRSEAEELLWDFDSKPLFPEGRPVAATGILQENLTAILRTLVDRTEGVRLVKTNRNKVLLSALLIGFISIVFAIYVSGIVVQKIKRIIRSAEAVGRGDLSVEFEHGGSDEFGTLTLALNQMVGGLNEREKIKGILGSMIDPVVVQEAMKDLQALKRGSEKNITAFFSDIASFSAISEKLTSPQLADLLNEYLSAMTIILKEHDGVLDKYIGDAIVGIFNSPVDVEDHVYKAALASIKMQAKLVELRKEWVLKKKYIPEAQTMQFRIGLNTGLAKVGFMGTDALASYTMMGDTVNLAARLEAAGKDYGVAILASDAVYEKIKDRIFTRRLDVVRVKGKNQPVTLYEVIAEKGKETTQYAEFVKRYEQGLAAYLQKSWDAAISFFKEAQQILKAADISSGLLIERCQFYKQNPPPANWDGVYTRTTK